MSYIYQVLSPTIMTIDAYSLNNAIKNYVRMNRNLKIGQMVIRDKQNHYKATMKYFRQRNIDKVGINVYPLTNYPSTASSVIPVVPLVPMLSPISPYPFIPTIRIEDHT